MSHSTDYKIWLAKEEAEHRRAIERNLRDYESRLASLPRAQAAAQSYCDLPIVATKATRKTTIQAVVSTMGYLLEIPEFQRRDIVKVWVEYGTGNWNFGIAAGAILDGDIAEAVKALKTSGVYCRDLTAVVPALRERLAILAR